MSTPEEIEMHVRAATAAARQYGGTVSRGSAALAWGWNLPEVPSVPHITVPRGRRLSDIDLRSVAVRRMTLPHANIDGFVTAKGRTLIDCGRTLPFRDALVLTDSALHAGFPQEEYDERARTAKGPGSIKVRQVHAHADGRVTNLFEALLHAVCVSVTGLNVVPQFSVRVASSFLGKPDFVDEELRIIIEADSFEWHGHRSALVADAQRYNWFVAEGWLVLRFTWEDVVFRPELVREILERVVAVAQTNRGRWGS